MMDLPRTMVDSGWHVSSAKILTDTPEISDSISLNNFIASITQKHISFCNIRTYFYKHWFVWRRFSGKKFQLLESNCAFWLSYLASTAS
jgi:hypothetical protein